MNLINHYGPEGIHFNKRPKVIISRWPDAVHRGIDLGFPPNN